MATMTYHRGKSVLVCSLGEVARGPMLFHLQNSSLGLSLRSPWKSTLQLERNPIYWQFLFEGFPQPFALAVGNVCKNLVVGVFVKSWSTNWPHWCRERNKFSDDHNKDEEDNEGMLIRNLIMNFYVKTTVVMMVMMMMIMMMMNTTCITIIVNWAASWPSFLCTVVLTNNNHNHHHGFFYWAIICSRESQNFLSYIGTRHYL